MRAVLARDIRIALRSGGGFGLALAFFFVLCVLVAFGAGPDPAVLSRLAPGAMWSGALLACLLSLDRMFALDWEDGTLEILATSPVPLATAALAKALAHWVTTGLPLVALAPALGPMLNLPTGGYGWLAVSLALGTPALSAIGGFGAAVAVGVRRGGLLVSLLVLPLYVPTLIYGVELARRGAVGESVEAPLAMVAGISLGALALMPHATAAALRAGMR